ncbi:hypothetical protein IU459_35900 [Nocardia amamiensis]|uniref:Uncharacterized protein n=1 Tax=Nocardia amamiensis TaxID=404578 RepID=A0ABS0D4E0_9NOCA|nr:hypothetical protein [Nocardia amamiensis]
MVSGSADTNVCLWDTATGRLLQRLTGHSCAVTSVHIASRTVVSTGHDTSVIVWSDQGVRLLTGHHTRHVWMAATEPAAELAVSVGADHTLRVWDIRSGAEESTIELSDIGTACDLIRMAPDRVLIASASRDGTMELIAATSNPRR